jgi:hypothetical protein
MDNIIKTEAEYLELERLAMKLGIPLPPTVRIKLESTLNGKLTDRYEDRSHTYTRNYWNGVFLWNSAFVPTGTTVGDGYLTQKLKGGSTINGAEQPYLGYANSDGPGIVVGTGNAAESFEGYALATQVLHGATSGKLAYLAQNPTTVVYTSATKTWVATLIRIFNNNSGAPIVIAEAGFFSSNQSMLSRDVLGTTITVANGGQLTVTYTISRVFPA